MKILKGLLLIIGMLLIILGIGRFIYSPLGSALVGNFYVPIASEFDEKIVYTTRADYPEEPLIKDCKKRGGTFVNCATPCGSGPGACMTVCAKACILEKPRSEEMAEYNDLIRVRHPLPEGTIASPFIIEGEARGSWFFEANFPVILTDWDGRIIASHYAEAIGEWMTEEYVPFKSELEFELDLPPDAPDFMKRGSLILGKSNASGLPEHDDAFEYTVYFE